MTDLKPGRELDAIVAEKVMGCKVLDSHKQAAEAKDQREFEKFRRRSERYLCGCEGGIHEDADDEGIFSWLKEYSTDIAAAFEVIQHVMATYRSKISIETYEGEIWSIKPCGTSSKSLPHAICLTALKALNAPKTSERGDAHGT